MIACGGAAFPSTSARSAATAAATSRSRLTRASIAGGSSASATVNEPRSAIQRSVSARCSPSSAT